MEEVTHHIYERIMSFELKDLTYLVRFLLVGFISTQWMDQIRSPGRGGQRGSACPPQCQEDRSMWTVTLLLTTEDLVSQLGKGMRAAEGFQEMRLADVQNFGISCTTSGGQEPA